MVQEVTKGIFEREPRAQLSPPDLSQDALGLAGQFN